MSLKIKADNLIATLNDLCGTKYDVEKQKGKIISFADDGKVVIISEEEEKELLTD